VRREDRGWPPVGGVWHRGTQQREVLEHDCGGGRVRYKSLHRTRWCKLGTWWKWAEKAVVGEVPLAPDEPVLLRDLGHEHRGLSGILAPPKPPGHPGVARLDGAAFDRWRSVVGECLVRGVPVAEVAAATGLTVAQVVKATKALRKAFTALGHGALALRREALWWDAVRLEATLTDHLLACVPGETDAREVAALAKALLEAQKHRATLCGATDAPTTQVNVNVGVVDPVQIAVQRFGLDPDQLGALGDGLAGQLTDRARVVLEADFEEAG